jgi:putative transposase
MNVPTDDARRLYFSGRETHAGTFLLCMEFSFLPGVEIQRMSSLGRSIERPYRRCCSSVHLQARNHASMKYDPEIHHRRSSRMPHWDYSWEWWYYVTIVVKDRLCLLGDVKGDGVALSRVGVAAQDSWRQIPEHHEGVELDYYQIMPNHVHGILILGACEDANNEVRRDVQLNVPTDNGGPLYSSRREAMSALSPKKGSLSVIIRTFKAAVTTHARIHGFSSFGWQERFHDHIIRNDADLTRIREYIANNPLQWEIDEENLDKKAL